MYARMKVENEMLKDAKMEAWIHYDDLCYANLNATEPQKIWVKIIGIDENGYFEDLLGRTCESIIQKGFETMGEALQWLEQKCKYLVIEDLSIRAWRGKHAQEKIDEINKNGFYL
jgi:hypothetical protein